MLKWTFAALLLLAGCKSPATTIRLVSKDATIAALTVTNATKADAVKLAAIADIVSSSVEGGVVDFQALRAQILTAIAAEFNGTQEVILLLLVDDVITLVLGEIDATTPPSEVLALVDAAATGVSEGAVFYGAIAKRVMILKVKTK